LGWLSEDVPGWLGEHIRAFVEQRSRGWQMDSHAQLTRDLLSRLCGFMRAVQPAGVQAVTPKAWFAYLGSRVKAGITPSSNNLILRTLQSFLGFLRDTGQAIDLRMLRVRPQKTGQRLPRNVQVPDLKLILKGTSDPLDRAWLLLMLHSGLRTCEVRRLRWQDVDLERHTIRIEPSKRLKSRVVFLSRPVVDALKALPKGSGVVFSRYHRRLSRGYCQSRLKTIGKTCGAQFSPHQLRHSAATLLLNAGMSIWGVKEILGHKNVDTTLGYARLYDGTVVNIHPIIHHKHSPKLRH